MLVEEKGITMLNIRKYEEPGPKLEISDTLQLNVSQPDNIEVVNTQQTKGKGPEIFCYR